MKSIEFELAVMFAECGSWAEFEKRFGSYLLGLYESGEINKFEYDYLRVYSDQYRGLFK